jgi:tetratricopeptide (TPR) repeat protein
MDESNWQRKSWLAIGILTLAAVLPSCTAVNLRQPDIPPLEGHELPAVPDVDLLQLSPAMHEFVEQFTGPESGRRSKAWSLSYAALDPYMLAFSYDPQVTLTADEAFRQRRGNCLTFAAMFVAMARDAGLEARFQEVIIPPKWSAVNDTVLVSKHVNAVVSDNFRNYTVDVSRRETSPRDTSQPLSDREARAQYFNNHGADALVREDLPLAYANFARALEIQPGLAYVWSNLGVVLRRNGQTDAAIHAYRAALQYDPDHAVALNNLHTIYTEEGDLEAAAVLARRVEKNRRNNPYYLLHLAEVANEEQRWSDAIGLLNQAIGIDEGEYRFYYALAQAQFNAGQVEVAQASLDRARALAPGELPESPLPLPDGP